MDVERLKCDLLDVFQNDDHSILDKWISSYREFWLCVDAKIEQELFYEKGMIPDCAIANWKIVDEKLSLRSKELWKIIQT